MFQLSKIQHMRQVYQTKNVENSITKARLVNHNTSFSDVMSEEKKRTTTRNHSLSTASKPQTAAQLESSFYRHQLQTSLTQTQQLSLYNQTDSIWNKETAPFLQMPKIANKRDGTAPANNRLSFVDQSAIDYFVNDAKKPQTRQSEPVMNQKNIRRVTKSQMKDQAQVKREILLGHAIKQYTSKEATSTALSHKSQSQIRNIQHETMDHSLRFDSIRQAYHGSATHQSADKHKAALYPQQQKSRCNSLSNYKRPSTQQQILSFSKPGDQSLKQETEKLFARLSDTRMLGRQKYQAQPASVFTNKSPKSRLNIVQSLVKGNSSKYKLQRKMRQHQMKQRNKQMTIYEHSPPEAAYKDHQSHSTSQLKVDTKSNSIVNNLGQKSQEGKRMTNVSFNSTQNGRNIFNKLQKSITSNDSKKTLAQASQMSNFNGTRLLKKPHEILNLQNQASKRTEETETTNQQQQAQATNSQSRLRAQQSVRLMGNALQQHVLKIANMKLADSNSNVDGLDGSDDDSFKSNDENQYYFCQQEKDWYKEQIHAKNARGTYEDHARKNQLKEDINKLTLQIQNKSSDNLRNKFMDSIISSEEQNDKKSNNDDLEELSKLQQIQQSEILDQNQNVSNNHDNDDVDSDSSAHLAYLYENLRKEKKETVETSKKMLQYIKDYKIVVPGSKQDIKRDQRLLSECLIKRRDKLLAHVKAQATGAKITYDNPLYKYRQDLKQKEKDKEKNKLLGKSTRHDPEEEEKELIRKVADKLYIKEQESDRLKEIELQEREMEACYKIMAVKASNLSPQKDILTTKFGTEILDKVSVHERQVSNKHNPRKTVNLTSSAISSKLKDAKNHKNDEENENEKDKEDLPRMSLKKSSTIRFKITPRSSILQNENKSNLPIMKLQKKVTDIKIYESDVLSPKKPSSIGSASGMQPARNYQGQTIPKIQDIQDKQSTEFELFHKERTANDFYKELKDYKFRSEDDIMDVPEAYYNHLCNEFRVLGLPTFSLIENNTLKLSGYKITGGLGHALGNFLLQNTDPKYYLVQILLDDNGLKDEEMAMLLKVVNQQQTLSYLSISNNEIGKKSIEQIKDFVEWRGKKIQELRFHGLKISLSNTFGLLDAIKEMPSLRKLRLSHINLSNGMLFKKVIAMLNFNYHITELDVSWTQMIPSQVVELVEEISVSTFLESLNISWNVMKSTSQELTDRFVKAMTTLLRDDKALSHLDLSGMNLKTCIMDLLPAFYQSKSLCSLHLSDNQLSQQYKELIMNHFEVPLESMDQKDKIIASKPLQAILDEHKDYLKNVSGNQFSVQRVVNSQLCKVQTNQKAQLTSSNTTGFIKGISSEDSFVLTRQIGAPEVIFNLNGMNQQAYFDRRAALKWNLNPRDQCYICHKWRYIVIFFQSFKAEGDFQPLRGRKIVAEIDEEYSLDEQSEQPFIIGTMLQNVKRCKLMPINDYLDIINRGELQNESLEHSVAKKLEPPRSKTIYMGYGMNKNGVDKKVDYQASNQKDRMYNDQAIQSDSSLSDERASDSSGTKVKKRTQELWQDQLAAILKQRHDAMIVNMPKKVQGKERRQKEKNDTYVFACYAPPGLHTIMIKDNRSPKHFAYFYKTILVEPLSQSTQCDLEKIKKMTKINQINLKERLYFRDADTIINGRLYKKQATEQKINSQLLNQREFLQTDINLNKLIKLNLNLITKMYWKLNFQFKSVSKLPFLDEETKKLQEVYSNIIVLFAPKIDEVDKKTKQKLPLIEDQQIVIDCFSSSLQITKKEDITKIRDENCNQLAFIEFLEFLCRIAHTQLEGKDVNLQKTQIQHPTEEFNKALASPSKQHSKSVKCRSMELPQFTITNKNQKAHLIVEKLFTILEMLAKDHLSPAENEQLQNISQAGPEYDSLDEIQIMQTENHPLIR